MIRLILPLLVAIALGAFLYVGIEHARNTPLSHIPSPLIGKSAPTFELPTLAGDNQRIGSDELLGQPYLLNVWASWCRECRVEHPFITDLAQSGRIAVYGLNWKDTREDATRWLRMFGDPFIASAFDESGRVGIDFGVYAAPETFLIDAQGTIRYKHIGPLSPKALEEEVLPIIESMHRESGS